MSLNKQGLLKYLNNNVLLTNELLYRQDHIGQYWKFLINALKMVKDAEQYFNKLIWKISRYENCESVDLDKNTKRILFKWINEKLKTRA